MGDMRAGTHEKKGISQKCICENGPAHPSSRPLSTVQYLSYDQRNDNANKFVSRIRDEIEQLAVVADAQNVCPEFEPQYLHRYDSEGSGGCQTHNLWMECSSKTR